MKHLFILIILFIHFKLVYAQSHNKETSTDKDEVRVFIDNRKKAISIPAYDTSYFYKPNGELDTLKILSDTALHWGGVFFETYTENIYNFPVPFYYGQYIIDTTTGEKKPVGKCLWFISSFYFQDENGVRIKNNDWKRVSAILYYDENGNLIMGFDIGYLNRKIKIVSRG